MSGMIDRLDEIAGEAGADVAEHLSDADVAARLSQQVRQGVRRRRTITASLSFVVVAMGTVAAVVLPQLMRPAEIPPAGPAKTPIETTDGIITYNDGSMQVLTHQGVVVNVPAPTQDAPVFQPTDAYSACMMDTRTLVQGWTPQFTDAFSLVSFGRPLLVDGSGSHGLTQGQQVTISASKPYAQFAFSVDVDPAIAPHVVLTLTSYAVAPDGRVAYYSSRLESQPAVDYSGDKASGTYTATLTARPLEPYYECDGQSDTFDPTAASGNPHYLTATVFLNDGHGHVSPVATHNSWITLVKESE